MEKVRFGIIGLGNQGSYYCRLFCDDGGSIKNGVLTAVADINPAKVSSIREKYGDRFAYFDSAEALMDSGLVDCVLIEVPHYQHPTLAIEALKRHLHAVVEKPAGVYTKQVQEMLDYAKTSDRLLGIMFNQRTNPAFKKMKELVASGEVGEVKRASWIITDWYRTQQYYDSGDWRATWEGEGGGVLYNQAPHQLDLYSWILGMMPSRVRAFCHFGKWHKIEVEDDVTAYLEFPNGATGTFITTTADAPGSNRFEITGTKGTLVFEGKRVTFTRLAVDEREHCFSCPTGFTPPDKTVEVFDFEDAGPQHSGILNNVANAILGLEPLYACADDGINGVTLANAMHLSTFLDKTIDLPLDGDLFYTELQKRIRESRERKAASSAK